MYVNTARSVGEALYYGLHALKVGGVVQESRVGDVLVLPRPVLTIYTDPLNRVLFSPMRDANPFFHVMEALWMLAGRKDLPWLAQFNKNITSYSDDGGQTQPGAYGYRWRQHFGYDQLATLIVELKSNPSTRRCVLTMWDGGQALAMEDNASPEADLLQAIAGSADVPCNTHAYFDTIDGKLNMTVCCRSNDIIWGAYGANAVHFSFLLEYISAMTGIPIGVYQQFSNNFHLYTNIVPREQIMPLAREVAETDRYLMRDGSHINLIPRSPDLRRVPLIAPGDTCWDADLEQFMSDPDMLSSVHPEQLFTCPFFATVALPMYHAYMEFKQKDYDGALQYAETIRAEDWRIACIEWLQRRQIKAKLNQERFTDVIEETHNAAE